MIIDSKCLNICFIKRKRFNLLLLLTVLIVFLYLKNTYAYLKKDIYEINNDFNNTTMYVNEEGKIICESDNDVIKLKIMRDIFLDEPVLVEKYYEIDKIYDYYDTQGNKIKSLSNIKNKIIAMNKDVAILSNGEFYSFLFDKFYVEDELKNIKDNIIEIMAHRYSNYLVLFTKHHDNTENINNVFIYDKDFRIKKVLKNHTVDNGYFYGEDDEDYLEIKEIAYGNFYYKYGYYLGLTEEIKTEKYVSYNDYLLDEDLQVAYDKQKNGAIVYSERKDDDKYSTNVELEKIIKEDEKEFNFRVHYDFENKKEVDDMSGEEFVYYNYEGGQNLLDIYVYDNGVIKNVKINNIKPMYVSRISAFGSKYIYINALNEEGSYIYDLEGKLIKKYDVSYEKFYIKYSDDKILMIYVDDNNISYNGGRIYYFNKKFDKVKVDEIFEYYVVHTIIRVEKIFNGKYLMIKSPKEKNLILDKDYKAVARDLRLEKLNNKYMYEKSEKYVDYEYNYKFKIYDSSLNNIKTFISNDLNVINIGGKDYFGLKARMSKGGMWKYLGLYDENFKIVKEDFLRIVNKDIGPTYHGVEAKFDKKFALIYDDRKIEYYDEKLNKIDEYKLKEGERDFEKLTDDFILIKKGNDNFSLYKIGVGTVLYDCQSITLNDTYIVFSKDLKYGIMDYEANIIGEY